MEPTHWLDKREERAWRTLQFMQLRLDAALAHQLAIESNLSYPDYLVLVALTDRSEGRGRVFQLARQLGWERSRLSHHLARMEDRGLVTKEKCPSDRRGAFAVVTDEGRRQLAAAAPGHVAAVRRLFIDRVSPDQLVTLADLAETVLAAFDDGDTNAGLSVLSLYPDVSPVPAPAKVALNHDAVADCERADEPVP
ncbi:MAG TPA: MarR family winged helix-turn-helix transcriptional regulator [Trebonia sp.]|nr:MarR family winged helix-turn-helix transcriptional regulator [Trebonia sp.]